ALKRHEWEMVALAADRNSLWAGFGHIGNRHIPASLIVVSLKLGDKRVIRLHVPIGQTIDVAGKAHGIFGSKIDLLIRIIIEIVKFRIRGADLVDDELPLTVTQTPLLDSRILMKECHALPVVRRKQTFTDHGRRRLY